MLGRAVHRGALHEKYTSDYGIVSKVSVAFSPHELTIYLMNLPYFDNLLHGEDDIK